MYAVTERLFDRMLDRYQSSLSWVMRHRRATMYFSGVMLLATICMFYAIPKGFLPSEDADQLIMFTLARREFRTTRWTSINSQPPMVIKDDPSIAQLLREHRTGRSGRREQ